MKAKGKTHGRLRPLKDRRSFARERRRSLSLSRRLASEAARAEELRRERDAWMTLARKARAVAEAAVVDLGAAWRTTRRLRGGIVLVVVGTVVGLPLAAWLAA